MVIKTRTITRKSLAWYDRGPGPAGYNLPPLVGRKGHAVTHLINPEYTLRPKFSYALRNFGPGAAAYLIPTGLKARGWDKSPAFSIRHKFDFAWKRFGPGPAGYCVPNLNCYKQKPPAFTLSSRNSLLSRYQTPAPNCYLLPRAIGPRIPDKMAAPEITMKGTRDLKEKSCIHAGDYCIGPCDLTKPRAPMFSLRRRFDDIKSRGFPCVGPASYDADYKRVKAAAPAWHLAERYNDFTGLYRTDCDKSSYEPLDV